MTKSQSYVTAREAAEMLGVNVTTIYAYVTRGLIRSVDRQGNNRSRLYAVEDVLKLQARKVHRRNPAVVAEQALHWGVPVLDSSITLIEDGRLFYRGYDVADLVEMCTAEQVAGLIWQGGLSTYLPAVFEGASGALSGQVREVLPLVAGLPPLERFQVLLPLAAVDDIQAYTLDEETVAAVGARIFRMMVGMAVGEAEDSGRLAAVRLAEGWTGDASEAVVDLLDAALILCADHELNVSTFTARCVASAGSTPYAVVGAGLAALRGNRHGGYTERVLAFFEEVGSPEGAAAAVASRLRRGERVPGFNHRLYPDGDPRARLLLGMVAEAFPQAEGVALAQAVKEEMQAATGLHPTIDLGLATLARVLGLPEGAALGLFGLGRTLGWVGHALEQYGSGGFIRPRARYVGVFPR